MQIVDTTETIYLPLKNKETIPAEDKIDLDGFFDDAWINKNDGKNIN